MHCTNCGKKKETQGAFCPYCGNPYESFITEKKSDVMPTTKGDSIKSDSTSLPNISSDVAKPLSDDIYPLDDVATQPELMRPKEPIVIEAEPEPKVSIIENEAPPSSQTEPKQAQAVPPPPPMQPEPAIQKEVIPPPLPLEETYSHNTEIPTYAQPEPYSTEMQSSFEDSSVPPEQLQPTTKAPPSQQTMDSIAVALDDNIKEEETQFEAPPLYITKKSKKPILATIIITVVIIAVLVVLGLFVFPNSSFGKDKSPLVVTNSNQSLAFGMTKTEVTNILGGSLVNSGENKVKSLEFGVDIVFREDKATSFLVEGENSQKWKTSAGVSVGNTRSNVFKAYGTDNLVSTLTSLGMMQDAAQISQIETYLVPYKLVDGKMTQIKAVDIVDYESNPLAYYWIAIRIDSNDLVDAIRVGDTGGVFGEN